MKTVRNFDAGARLARGLREKKGGFRGQSVRRRQRYLAGGTEAPVGANVFF